MRRRVVASIVVVLFGALLALAGCGDEPVVVSREALGTVVTITAYGEDEDAVTAAIEGAYTAMAAVEAQLDAYDNASAIAQFNANPYAPAALPPDANTILDEVGALGVGADFSPSLLGVVRLYDFEGSAVTRQQINGIASMSWRPVTRRLGDAFARGIDLSIEFDEDKYVGTGLFLFASVLERFLGRTDLS